MSPALALKSAKLWREYPREILVLGILGAAAVAAMAGAAYSTPTMGNLPGQKATMKVAPPAPPPLLVRALEPQDAIVVNAAMPFANGANPGAKPFALGGADEATRARALECLTSTVYYEAGNEIADGQRSVAQVVLNRVRHAAFPSSVCGVVYQGSTRSTGCQFTFTCDGSLARKPSAGSWARARTVAEAALAGYVHKPVGYATHYHANYVVPYWASSLAKNAVVGTHIFYRWSGGWGRPPAFSQRYARVEPNSEALREAAVLAEVKTEAVDALAAIPGSEMLPPGVTSGKKGERVGIRFNLAARKAVEDAVSKDKPYLEKVGASDNLRWTLSGGMKASEEKPLGKSPAARVAGTGPALTGSTAVTAQAATPAAAAPTR